MPGKSKLCKLLDKIAGQFGHDTLKDVADLAGTDPRKSIRATRDEIRDRYDDDLWVFFEGRATRALSRDQWNDLAECFGLDRRRSLDEIYAQLDEVL